MHVTEPYYIIQFYQARSKQMYECNYKLLKDKKRHANLDFRNALALHHQVIAQLGNMGILL